VDQGLAAGHGAQYFGRVSHITPDRLHSRALQRRRARARERCHLVPALQQPGNGMGTDKARRPGNKNLHRRLVPRYRCTMLRRQGGLCH